MEIFGVYLVNQNSGMTIPLLPDKGNIIGRGIPDQKAKRGEILLPHPSISKIHARIELSKETHQWFLYDLSRHGLCVNGEKIEKEILLEHGDKIEVGPFVLMFYEKFKADDETAEQPLPLARGSHNYLFFIYIFLLTMIEFILVSKLPKFSVILSFTILALCGLLIGNEWGEKIKLNKSQIMLIGILALIGGIIGIVRL